MNTCSRYTWVALFAGLGAITAMSLGLVEAFGTSVVYGPAAKELVLLTSKIAAKQGHESYCICGPGQESKSNRLMYGAPYENKDDEDEGKDVEGKGDDDDNADADEEILVTGNRATPISSGDDMQNALSKASTLFLVCYDNPIEEKSVSTLLSFAGSDLSKVVMLSKMGATADAGFFGGGFKLMDSENSVRKLCKQKNLDLSIVRAGQLKGGGPGEPFELDYGLHKSYYYTLFELSEASCTMSHDQFTLGVDCTKGDSVDVPNALTIFGTRTSFEAYPYDTNRINAAMACVMAAKHDKPVEFSIGSAKSYAPPTAEEWTEILTKMEA